jgi:hypothetical protein
LGSTVVPKTTRRQGRSPRRRTGLMQQHPPKRSQARPARSDPLITTLKNDRIALPHPPLTGNMRC